jgi:hypothetical protein
MGSSGLEKSQVTSLGSRVSGQRPGSGGGAHPTRLIARQAGERCGCTSDSSDEYNCNYYCIKLGIVEEKKCKNQSLAARSRTAKIIKPQIMQIKK